MKVRFQADADLNQIILRALIRHEPKVDFQTATQAVLAGLTDQDVLAMAMGEGRVLVTHDQKTMPYHFADFIASHTSPGLWMPDQVRHDGSTLAGLQRIVNRARLPYS